jgi:glycosyltransferase involved in cell wall biosynthesis
MIYFQKKGYQAELCVLKEIGSVADWFISNGIKVTFFPLYKSQLISTNPFIFFKFYLYILLNRFGIIICVQAISHYLGRLACLPPMGRRIIAMERTNIDDRSKGKLILDLICSLWTHRIICVSQHIADFLLKKSKINPDKILVIVDPTKISPPSENPVAIKDKIKNKFVFGTIGNFFPLKCHRILIESFSKIVDNCPDSVLLLVGDGPEEENLRQLCKALNIEDKVFFVGKQLFPHDFYPLFDVFVFPSLSEGSGTVFYEAMHHRVPVICSNIRPFSDYIMDGHNGLLFKPESIDELSEKMMRIYQNALLRNTIKFNGYDLAKKHFDYELLMGKLFHAITGKKDMTEEKNIHGLHG